MVRTEKWTRAMQDATPAQFRGMIGGCRKEQIQNAVKAGRSLAKLMLDGHVNLMGIDDVQLERFRRRYAVHENLVGVMYGVATGQLTDDLLNERLDNRFSSCTLASGKIRLAQRCPMCAKRVCRCLVANAKVPRGTSYDIR